MKINHQTLQSIYEDLTWETYITLCDEITNIDDSDLEEELSKQSTLYSYFTGLHAYAETELDKFEVALNQEKSLFKRKLVSESGKQTVAQMDIAVGSDHDINLGEIALLELEYKEQLLKGLVHSLSQRKDMLVQISSNKKAEKQMYS